MTTPSPPPRITPRLPPLLHILPPLLTSESHLFTPHELELLKTVQSLPIPAAIHLTKLLQRKRKIYKLTPDIPTDLLDANLIEKIQVTDTTETLELLLGHITGEESSTLVKQKLGIKVGKQRHEERLEMIREWVKKSRLLSGTHHLASGIYHIPAGTT